MALPKDQEESDTAFVHHGADALPSVNADGISARVIAGSVFGSAAPLTTPSDTLYADIALISGSRTPIDATTEERAHYTISGRIEIAGRSFDPGQLIVLRPGGRQWS